MAVTILVDPPIWAARGRRWSHLASDESLDELHDFAARLGLPARAFHGDHYDLPAEYVADAVAAGAVEVGARELVRRLRAAGLRLSPARRRAAREPGGRGLGPGGREGRPGAGEDPPRAR